MSYLAKWVYFTVCDNELYFQHEVVERVKARLQEEGREARNLVAYSLPLQDPSPIGNGWLCVLAFSL